MQWLLSLDTELFRFINLKLSNPVLDAVMPFLSGNAFFVPGLVVGLALLAWKGRARGALCVLMLGLVLGLGDAFVTNTIKHAIARPRPFLVIPDAHCLVGKSGSGSMPSSHAANWFAATMVVLVYYRRSILFMAPMALLVSFSRIYNGVHFPSDVLAGAILGAGYAAAMLWLFNSLWQWAGRKWFPLWWERMPSLVNPPPPGPPERQDGAEEGMGECEYASEAAPASAGVRARPMLPKKRGQAPAGFRSPHASPDTHWLRLGYIVIAALLLARLAYIASGTIELSEDEAYQWLWSKHLALSYYSKPLLIALTQFAGTTLWGDTAFGVRFFSPIISALLGIFALRFFAREFNARAGFFLLLILTATPLLAVGSVLMTVDPLSVLFWTLAMFAGWKAARDTGTTGDWLRVGLWMGLGFLSKYTELLQPVCWVVFFVLWPPARKQLRRPGPYLALLLNALLTLPVVIWNGQHHWITALHVAQDAGAGDHWHFRTLDFIGSEFGLCNPIFFIGAVWAAVAMWRRARNDPRLVYFFSMGAPVFLAFLVVSVHTRILPNWIAPGILPVFCLMAGYWDTRWRLGARHVQRWFAAGLLVGLPAVLVFHNTDIVGKLTKHYLPVAFDPLHRVRQWKETARVAGEVRNHLLTEGKPVFIITDHYGMAGQISFYLPEARESVKTEPLVYFRTSPIPENELFFWPGYTGRKGQNAIFVVELSRKDPKPELPPAVLTNEFESVTSIGVSNILYHGEYLLRPLQFFECRNLR